MKRSLQHAIVALAVALALGAAHAAEPRAPKRLKGRVAITNRQVLEALLLGPQARSPGLTLGGARLRLPEVPQLHAPEAAASPSKAAGRGAPRRPSVSPFSGPMPEMRRPASLVPQPTPTFLNPPGGPL